MVLIKLLAEAPAIVNKDELLSHGWPGVATGDDVLAVAISHLRKALGDSARSPKYIKTISGQGYQWVGTLKPGMRQQARLMMSGEAKTDETSRRPLVWLIAVLTAAILIWAIQPDPMDEAREWLFSDQPEDWPRALAVYEDAWAAGDQSVQVIQGIVESQWRILEQEPRQLHSALDELRAWLDRAVELEPDNPEVHARRAHLEFMVAWQPEAAKQHYETAIRLDPDNADYLLWQSYLQLALGEFDAATESLEQARSLDPRHYAREMAAWIYNMQRKYDQASIELERLVEIRPDTLNYHVSAQSVLENSGDHDRSFDHLGRVLSLRGYGEDNLVVAETRYRQSGLAGVYRWLLEDMQETRNIGQYQPPLAYARYAIRYGDYDAALNWLEEAVEKRQYELLWINVDPKYDPVRDDPRFKSIVQSIGLPILNNS